MSRLFVNQFKENEIVSEIYRLREKSLRLNKRGSFYMQFNISDRTGSVTAFFWNATEEFAQKFEEGDFVFIDGTVQLFQGKLQVIARRLAKVDSIDVCVEDFTEASGKDVGALEKRLREILGEITNASLAALVDAFLKDEAFLTRFVRSFAGVRLHHAYPGGLLEHTVSMMELARFVGRQYSEIVDSELLLVGAFLHDVGKTIELSDDPVNPVYSDEGQALGHLFLGAELVSRKIAEVEAATGEPFEPMLALKIKHMILSHHGDPEFGSAKVPRTREAIALHLIDSLDAKLNEFQKFIKDDPNFDKRWTNYNVSLERKLLK